LFFTQSEPFCEHVPRDADQHGGQGFTIRIDSKTTSLGPAYVAGPVTTPPLLDVPPGKPGETHMITLGAFLHPMTPGTHVVEIEGGYFGDAILQTYGIRFIALDFTYQVRVG
jgi:hypothetical protein